MTQIKNGRKPLPVAGAKAGLTPSYKPKDILTVDEKLAQEIIEQGLEYRWIDVKAFTGGGNFHKHDWQPYKRTSKNDSAILDIKYGNDPEGYIRRQSLVLAVRSRELGDEHRLTIKEMTRRQHGDLRKRQAEQMRQTVRESGVKATVLDGDDDDN